MREMNIAKIVAGITTKAAEQAERVLVYVEMVKSLESAGLDMRRVDEWDVKSTSGIAVTRAELPTLRKVVGKLKVQYKSPAYDFDTTNELQVTIQPVDKELPFSFTYRTKYRKGGKCKVVEQVSPAYVSKSLVCEV